jgi:cbb3-type cytochrome oxidase subunit 3
MAALISAAKAGDAEAARQLETAFLSVLSLGKRLDWMQWRVLVQRMDSPRELRRVSAFVRAYPNRLPLLYTSLLMSGDDPVQTVAAVEKLSGRTATPLEELSLIARLGTGALRKYIEDPKPLYEAPPLLARLEPVVQRVQPEPLVALGANRPGTAGLAKTLAFVGAGLLTMLGLSAWWRAAASLRRAKPREAGRPGAAEDFADTRGGWVMIVRYLASALIVCAVLWAMAEPRLLEHEQARAELRFDLVFTQTIGSLSSGSMMMGAIDQVTLLVLLLFFLVQLVIYAFCLIKISEIRRSAVPAAVRLSLLENEDNLFDMGLYVGLGGTVASLILVTLGVVEASLMAAYASTLFGILTTAIIKVFHLRPLRRNLILEREGRVLE